MTPTIDQIAASLRDGLAANPMDGSTSLVLFANTYALDSTLPHTALILKLDYGRAQNDEQRQRLLGLMLTLVDEIVADTEGGPREGAAEPLAAVVERAQDRYRDMPVPRDLVFACGDLGKTYRKSGFHLQGVSLQLRLGEITAVVGENGNGKTTLFRLVVGELLHDAGSMAFPLLDQASSRRKGIDWVRVKRSLAYVPQELPKWYGYGDLRENLEYEAAIHGVPASDNRREVDFIVQRLGLSEHLDKRWPELSGGFKLRFALARALVWKPRLLVIDEPLANLDFKAQQVVLQDLRHLADGLRHPVSVLISSQHLHEVEAIADHILFLEQGQVKFNGPIDTLGEQRRVNTFELRTDCTEQVLRERLAVLQPIRFQDRGVAFVVTLPLGVTQRELLRHLLDQGVEVEYFRDISRSIKQLFH